MRLNICLIYWCENNNDWLKSDVKYEVNSHGFVLSHVNSALLKLKLKLKLFVIKYITKYDPISMSLAPACSTN